MLSLPSIERALTAHSPVDLGDETTPKRAAVAALLRYRREAPDVLLMERAERPGDRWSGQVALPGGRWEPQDDNLLQTAIRETREEVGRHLDHTARYLGRLSDVRARSREGLLPLAIRPFVFVEERHEPVVLNHEAAAAIWLPLDAAAAGHLDDTFAWELDAGTVRFPCWRYEGHVVWGLTHRMLNQLLEVVRADPLRHHS